MRLSKIFFDTANLHKNRNIKDCRDKEVWFARQITAWLHADIVHNFYDVRTALYIVLYLK